jgi:hypothetical protein
MKYLINKMQFDVLSQQMGWLDGRGVYLHPRGQRIKPHEWCVVNNGKFVEYFPM